MSTYLVSLVAGEFDKREEKWTVPVDYYVPHGRGGDITRTFGRTTQMLEFFSTNIAPYPWAKYAVGRRYLRRRYGEYQRHHRKLAPFSIGQFRGPSRTPIA